MHVLRKLIIMRTSRLRNRARRSPVLMPTVAIKASLEGLALIHMSRALEGRSLNVAAPRRELLPVWIEGFGFSTGAVFC
jgi:hypothetical protein